MIVKVEKEVHEPEDLLTLPGGEHYELIDGKVVEPKMSLLSQLVAGELHTAVNVHARAGRLGWVFPEPQFRCFPHAPKQVRKPDLAFIRLERLSVAQLEEGFALVAPDLAAEVVSPHDLFDDVEIRVDDFLRAGTRLVWVVSLKTQQVYVHRADGTIAKVRSSDELDGEDVLPGFRCRVGTLFPQPAAAAGGNPAVATC